MSKLPIACRLSEQELEDVVAHYSRAAERYQAVVRYQGDRALIDLRGPKDELVRLIEEMSEQEGSCCSHLRFDVAETGQGYSVVLTVDGLPGQELATLRQAVPVLFPTAIIAPSVEFIVSNPDRRRQLITSVPPGGGCLACST